MSKVDQREQYPKKRDLSFIVSLIIGIISIRLAAEIDAVPKLEIEAELPVVAVEHIPVTRQGKRKPPPPRPAVPVPVENDDIPEEETIDPVDVAYFANDGADGGAGTEDDGIGTQGIVPPRPIAWVIPEYPDKERKRGVRGEVTLSLEIDARGRVVEAIVLENSTGSDLCAEAAKRAALASRFIPAKKLGKPTTYWLIQPYRFDLSK